MNSNFTSYLDTPFPESLTANALSIAVIGPDDTLRKAAVSALVECHDGNVQEFASYPPGLDDLPHLLDQNHEIVMIELDSNPEYALDLVEGICASGSSTVMVYSKETDPELSDPDLLMRCMRAGAREFLGMPFAHSAMAEALVRAAARRPPTRVPKKASGRLLVFCGAKGGAGVTAVACNFAVALARESSESTLLIDLDLPLGDTAINLGIAADYSTIDALQSFNRLDSSFLSKLLTKHSSGLSVLSAPGNFSTYRASNDAIDRLLTIARHDFENIVVDAGSKLDLSITTAPFRDATTVYLVTQSGIPELRNANRLISQYFNGDGPKLEIVLNRYESKGTRFSDEDIRKALTRPATWKIPNDYGAVRKMQDTASPLTLTDSFISWQISQMARSACGLPEIPQKKKGFSLKGIGKGNSSKGSTAGESASILQLGLITGEDADAEREAFEGGSVLDQQGEPETRIYNSETYARGVDGRWYLQEILDGISEELPTVEWSTPDPIFYGTPLNADHFSATSSVPGRFSYTPTEGYVLPAGTHTLWVTFNPLGTARNTTLQASVALTVNKAMPTITWPRPFAISCGMPLSTAQLNATVSIPGTFEYIPGEGDVPNVGVQSLLVAFTPKDTINYVTAQAEVSLTVTKAATTITWPTPSPISHGTPLDAAQLNATASVPGTFAYLPAEGSVLSAGSHTLSVAFTPTDSTNHTVAQAEVTIAVTKTMPIITWLAPQAISYGTPLSVAELTATSSVPGAFVYIPGEGAVLAAGRHTPAVIFTPADAANYTAARAAVSLTVTKAVPTITWPTPETISYGTELSAAELNAAASVQGTFAYNPAMGATLTEGSHTLTVTFTPLDATNFTIAKASATLAVTKATPIAITWPQPAAISYGTPLSAAQLNATASVAGKFVYSPSEGNILTAGNHTLTVTFAPADTNFPTAQGRLELTVTRSKPTITWLTPRAISYGIALNVAQLNAAASVPGTFGYSPADGDVPKAGIQRLSATFIPTDIANYEKAQADVQLTVTKAIPIILWPVPAAISYGTALGGSQLNAAASISGNFAYAPTSGTVLTAGTQTLSVSFNPADSNNYTTTQAAVTIVVNEMSSIAFLTPPEVNTGSGESFHPLQAADVRPAGQKLSTEEKIERRGLPMGKGLATGTQMPLTVSDKTEQANAKRGSSEMGGTPNRGDAPETRTYKGATYQKGPDGQWHLQQKIDQRRPGTLPADFGEWDSGSSPATLPDDFDGFDAAPKAGVAKKSPAQVSNGQTNGRITAERLDRSKSSTATSHSRGINVVAPVQTTGLDLKSPRIDSKSKRKTQVTFIAIGSTLLLLTLATVIYFKLRPSPVTQSQAVANQSQLQQASQPQQSPMKPSPSTTVLPAGPAVSSPTETAPPPRVQPESMNNQLAAPTRIPRDIRSAGEQQAPGMSAVGMEAMNGAGGETVSSVFKGKGAPVVKAETRTINISSGVATGLLLRKATPVYPPLAKSSRVSGTVVLKATISKAGAIEDLRVISGSQMLRQAALDAVKTWRYKPYMLNNQPVEVETTVDVIFSLGQ